MSLLSSLLMAAPADAVVEIGAEAVSAATLSGRAGQAAVDGFAIEPLPPGAVVPSLTSPNIADRAAVVERLKTVVGRLPSRPRRVALLIPDIAARVSFVRFDQLPARPEDLDELVRWQLKKAAPFPVEGAVLTHMPAVTTAEGGFERLAVVARQDVVRGYESVCEELGLHPGLVDLSTFGVVNAGLAALGSGAGDWLLVHVRREYTSLAIVRGPSVIFFRSLSSDDADGLADVVHQTAMYYQDRLAGTGFSRVLLGGSGSGPEALDAVRRELEARLGATIERVDPLRVVTFADRIGATPDVLARLAPLAGTWLRMRTEAAAA
jgi:Tfp pilus assembly PilM family ATPase